MSQIAGVPDPFGDGSGEVPDAVHFQVGKPWPLGAEWTRQRSFSWIADANVLLMVEDRITSQACEDFAGDLELSLIAYGPLVGVLAKFSGVWSHDWAESLMWRRQDQGLPELFMQTHPDEQFTFTAVLAETGTGTIRALRRFTVSPGFTRALLKEARDRWSSGVTAEEGAAAAASYYARYPDTRKALRDRIARSTTAGLSKVDDQSVMVTYAQRWSPLSNPPPAG